MKTRAACLIIVFGVITALVATRCGSAPIQNDGIEKAQETPDRVFNLLSLEKSLCKDRPLVVRKKYDENDAVEKFADIPECFRKYIFEGPFDTHTAIQVDLKKFRKDLNVSDNVKEYECFWRANFETIEILEKVTGDKYFIVSFSSPAVDHFLFLVFENEGAGWYFKGHIASLSRSGQDNAVVRLAGGSVFLLIRMNAGWGTGIFNDIVEWHLISRPKVERLLTHPFKGHVIGWPIGFDREYKLSDIKIDPYTSDGQNLIFDFYARYSIEPDTPPIFEYRKKTIFRWDMELKEFTVHENSEMSREQIDGLFDDGEDGLLEHNFAELCAVAKEKDPIKLICLKKFLSECKDCEKKEMLLEQIQ
jgi:hypothetical protein